MKILLFFFWKNLNIKNKYREQFSIQVKDRIKNVLIQCDKTLICVVNLYINRQHEKTLLRHFYFQSDDGYKPAILHNKMASLTSIPSMENICPEWQKNILTVLFTKEQIDAKVKELAKVISTGTYVWVFLPFFVLSLWVESRWDILYILL